MHFETLAIRAGQQPDPTTGAVVVPIHMSATFVRQSIDQEDGYGYSRVSNPTRHAVETCLAALEGAKHALFFSSGMAAENAILGLLKPGDHIVCIRDLYGGTHTMLETIARQRGIETTYVDCSDLDAVQKAFQPPTRLLWLESPTNPLLQIVDLRALSMIGKGRGARVVVDNTFATPYLQNPLALGADLVLHSATKYLGGHSDLIAGALAFNEDELYEPLWDQQAVGGAVPSPFDCWLILRGMKTLAVRMREHERNAAAIAQFLEAHPKVEKVFYPGLPSHPQYELAKRQMRGFGGMIGVFIQGGREGAKRVCESTRIFSLASSLGGVESLIGYPPTMSHSSMGEEERLKRGLTDNFVRLSVGIEHVEDLIEDLSQALAKV